MKIFLATPATHTKIFTKINPRYCLETFFELKRKKKDSDIIKYMQYKNKQASFLLDSGAFSFMRDKNQLIDFDKYVEDYVKFIDEQKILKIK